MISVKAKLENAGINVDAIETGMIESFERVVGHIASNAKGEWVRLAQGRLRTSRDDYIAGLQKADSFKVSKRSGATLYEIALIGEMPNNFEFGMNSFDMKAVRPGWLGGGKAKTAKEGHKYITIPFRHSTTSNARIDYSGRARRENLKQDLRRTVKRYGLDRMVRTGTGRGAPPRMGPVRRVPRSAPVHPYLRALTRTQHVERKTGRSYGQLNTWRVMSEKSDAGSWMHPGIRPANLMEDVLRFVDNEFNTTIKKMFGGRL